MYEEPYRWVEAVGNRRQYLDEQLKQGSPVVALSYADGTLLLTVSRGTPKLYEIYDRIALGGVGHPADLEKLRFSLLEMAHLEGFNRSPSDVTGARMMKLGLAPIIKQAFEEIFKAPFIVKILLAELSVKPGKDTFLTIDYDGTFEETSGCAVLAATKAIQTRMVAYLKQAGHAPTLSLDAALAQAAETETDRKDEKESDKPVAQEPDDAALLAHLRETLADKTLEGAVLERQAPGSSKYRAITREELASLVPKSAQASA
jgi:proteasome alpha subunit